MSQIRVNVPSRIPKPFLQKRGKELYSPKKKCFILVEGSKTEQQYFRGVNSFRREMLIDELIEIVPVDRCDRHSTHGHPLQLASAIPQIVESEDFDGAIDEISLIFDRDPQNFSENQYHELKRCCREYEDIKIRIGISNPCFEFWLLNHLPGIDQYSREELIVTEKFQIERGLLIRNCQTGYPPDTRKGISVFRIISKIVYP